MSSPVLRGYSTDGGWRTLFDYAAGADSGAGRVRVATGPVSYVDTYRTKLLTDLAVKTLDVSTSPGSAVATIRVTYDVIEGALPLGERRWPIYATYPSMAQIDLKAHPELDTIADIMPVIERLVASGDIAAITSGYVGNELALKFARCLLAGITSYEAPAFNLAVTRYYKDKPSIASDYASINKVFAWSAIRTDDKAIPAYVDQPKYQSPTLGTVGYEWRLISVAPVVQRGQVNTVQWQFLGLERWCAWLYVGGTWEPDTL